MTEKKIGAFICRCGGNISDYVDVEQVREEIAREENVTVAEINMFSCSDASQEDMIANIRENGLDGIVIASCSPKLHLNTFRAMAERAGLNPYQYIQVNIREQCSWAHTHNKDAATRKAVSLVREGVAKAKLSEPLTPIELTAQPSVMVIGAGLAGMRSALALGEMGVTVYLVEAAPEPGGSIKGRKSLFPDNSSGHELVESLLERIRANGNIVLYTSAEILEKTGSVGNFTIRIQVDGKNETTLSVGAVIVSTGSGSYRPTDGEFGFGLSGVLTLNQYIDMLDSSTDTLLLNGRKIRNIAYIYCVGSRQNGKEGNRYCSRYCCSAAVHTAVRTHEIDPSIGQFHFYRDIRTYGAYEELYHEALKKGSVFLKYGLKDPPQVTEVSGSGLRIRAADLLTGAETMELETDLVVLVTGMVPGENSQLIDILKLPVGKEGFFNEIHPKLRPVETVMDGIYIAGACQGPKTLSESVASGMAAVAKSASLVLTGKVNLDPFVARVLTEKCTGCGECISSCPYGAISMKETPDGTVVEITESLCKGEGACVAICNEEALEIKGYGHNMIKAMIEALGGRR